MQPTDVLLAMDPAPAAGGGSFLSMLPMLAVFVAIFYFLVLRPQTQEAKTQAALIAGLQKGDRVVTIGGIHGVIHEAKGETLVLEVHPGNFLTVDRASVRRKATAAKEA